MTASFLFEDLPRAALLVLVAGLALRWLALALRPPAEDTAVGSGWQGLGRLGMVALVLVLVAHLAALLAPQALAAVSRARLRLYLLEASGFLIGLVALLAWARLVVRHLRAQGPSLTAVADSVLLALVAVALVSGLVIAVRYRWASLWGAATLTPYVRSLARGRPMGLLAAPMPLAIQLHLVSTFAALAVLPLSRLSLALLLPLHRSARRLGAWMARPVRAVGRLGRTFLARPAAWIWPEEE
ncbi:MAG TPA: respiratory nitrate reductase subunit gamma [Polyangia bacterium]|nr:respiratory nitrate reductase subunit gamma [Polyangia bacterium]